MPNKCIMLSGWKGSGKDEIAKYLTSNHGFKRVAFADILKDHVSKVYNIDRSFIDTNKEEPLGQYPFNITNSFDQTIFNEIKCHLAYENNQYYWTPRALCVLEGNTKRCVDPECWVKSALRKVNRDDNIVVTDCRFPNEVQEAELWSTKCYVVRVDRFDLTTSTDASERSMDNYDFNYIIKNKGSIEDLHKGIEVMLTTLEA
jgi:hypothetical protein